jgi:hypothetical protein
VLILATSTGFLPTLEKFGKNVQLLLGEEDVHFVQSVLNTDGTQATIRFAVVCAHAAIPNMRIML